MPNRVRGMHGPRQESFTKAPVFPPYFVGPRGDRGVNPSGQTHGNQDGYAWLNDGSEDCLTGNELRHGAAPLTEWIDSLR